MCGIIGYISSRGQAIERVFTGLKHLEHRGYDSAGCCFFFPNKKKEVYKISNHEVPDFSIKELAGEAGGFDRNCHLGIGHTRWATYGLVNKDNAHPHCDKQGRIWVVHNGNVLNFDQLKKNFADTSFYSETDTELIANLVFRHMEEGFAFFEALEKTMADIEGANSVLAVDSLCPERIVAANRGGTLIYRRNSLNEFLIVSDPEPLERLLGQEKFSTLGDNEFLVATERKEETFRLHTGPEGEISSEQPRGEYPYLMEKEINEQPFTLRQALKGRMDMNRGITRFGGLEDHVRDIRSSNCFHFLGCGTAYNACCFAVLILNRFGIKAQAHISSEFCHQHKVFEPSDNFFIISQSGETADSVKALEEIEIKGNPVFGIINREGSRIWQRTGAGIHIRAGSERAVASTKAFTCQLAVISMLAVYLARQRKMTADTAKNIMEELNRLPEKVSTILNKSQEVKLLAAKYVSYGNFYFLGRYFSSVVAAEGALKLKEVSYVHAEDYPLGEMKHGPIALVEDDFISLVIVNRDSTFNESLSNIREIKARGGKVIAITDFPDFYQELVDDVVFVPSTFDYLSPLLSIVPLQLFAYYFALSLGWNPDKPRNLAKTVTVS